MVLLSHKPSRLKTWGPQENKCALAGCPERANQSSSLPVNYQAYIEKRRPSGGSMVAPSLETISYTSSGVVGLYMLKGQNTESKSWVSPLALSRRRDVGPSMLGSGTDCVLESGIDEALSSITTSAFKVASGPACTNITGWESLTALDDPHKTPVELEDDFTPEYSSSSSASIRCSELQQEKQSLSGLPRSCKFPNLELYKAQGEWSKTITALPTDPEDLSSRSYPFSVQETLDASHYPAIRAPMKRIREIVQESLSCDHDSEKPSATVMDARVPRGTCKSALQAYGIWRAMESRESVLIRVKEGNAR